MWAQIFGAVFGMSKIIFYKYSILTFDTHLTLRASNSNPYVHKLNHRCTFVKFQTLKSQKNVIFMVRWGHPLTCYMVNKKKFSYWNKIGPSHYTTPCYHPRFYTPPPQKKWRESSNRSIQPSIHTTPWQLDQLTIHSICLPIHRR